MTIRPRLRIEPGPAAHSFSFSVLDDISGRWHRSTELTYRTYDEALEAATTFMKYTWDKMRRHVAVRIISV